MSKVIASVPWFPGTNCHKETMFALERVGAEPKLVLLNELIAGKYQLDECDLMVLVGGFSFGDYIAAGRIAANDLVVRFSDQMSRLIEKQIPILGICNGFQTLVEMGLLPGDGELGRPTAALDHNVSARFEHWGNIRVVLHEPEGVDCVWTKGLDGTTITMPVAHGQGRPVLPNGPGSYNVMATYGTYEGVAEYPTSPNGSLIAGLCTDTIVGLMPHPERADEVGLAIFDAGVKSVR